MYNIKEELIETYNKIIHEAEIKFCHAFLEKTNLKVGDKVQAYFYYSSGNSKQSYHTGTFADGIITQQDDGIINVVSIGKFKKSKHMDNGRHGRYYKSWIVYEDINVNQKLINIKL
jgi:hypothetical protein